MRRREFMMLLALVPAMAAHDADAQTSGTIARIGTLDYGSSSARRLLWDAFYEKLRDLGYAPGRNLAVEARWAEAQAERLGPLAAELVAAKVDIIVTAGAAAALAAQQTTRTIPIVAATGDLLSLGLVSSLARPVGNVTGFSTQTAELSIKRLELLRELVPTMSRLAILSDELFSMDETRAVAERSGLSVEVLNVRGPEEFDAAFAAIERMRAQALLVSTSATFFGERHRLAELAMKARLPMVVGQREYAEAGGLLAYAANLAEGFRHAASYVEKILKGAKPADLPIQQPTKFELVINLKTARAIGLTIPESFLLRADEVIE